jgi:DNA-binding response OmpR family regulator
LARASVQVYLEKPFTVEELQARIGEIRARERRDL